MPPQFPSQHRGMTANPLKPVKRYRPGKALAEDPSSEEEDDDEEEDLHAEEERRRQQEAQRRKQQQSRPAPKATSFPSSAAGKITKGVQGVKIDEEGEDEEGFVTEEEEEEEQEVSTIPKPPATHGVPAAPSARVEAEEEEEDEDEDESEEEESSEEESSEDEGPKRVLLRPTFIKKDKRKESGENGAGPAAAASMADSAAEAEARRVQRQEKADMLIREQLEKAAMARAAADKAWDDDEEIAAEEDAIDDRDGLDPEGEYAAWKLRELKRVKREREAIEAAEKEREEIERRRNLTADEREREDQEFIARQKEERDAHRGQTGYMQKYFHKGAFFQDDLERERLDKRDIMGSRFADDTNREVLPQYMQIRDMTKLGRKGRTKYKDLRSEDTGRWGEGFNNRPGRPRDETLVGVTDARFLPDSNRRDDDRNGKGPTGANASAVRDRRPSRSRQRSRSRSYSPRRDRHRDGNSRYDDRDRDRDRDRHRDDVRQKDRYDDRNRDEDGRHRKRSHSPYGDREKRRRVDSVSPRR